MTGEIKPIRYRIAKMLAMKKLLLQLSFFIPMCSLSAQTADDIVAKYVAALGGMEKLKTVKTLYMEGSQEMMGNEMTVRITKEQGKLSRREFDMAGATGFFLVTDKEAWNYMPMRAQQPTQMPAEALPGMQSELDIFGPLVNYAEKGNTVELVGKDSANGKSCFKLKMTNASGRDMSYWIDDATYLLVQSTARGGFMGGGRRGGGGGGGEPGGNAGGPPRQERERRERFMLYNDYKPVDGILFPHNIEMYVPGGEGPVGGGTTFDKIEINKPVKPELYKPE